MTIIISKTKLALGVLATVLIGATVVAAGDGPFTDNPDGTFYHESVNWAYATGVTTGTSATTFSPEQAVTRAQNVTFAYRYDQNVVQPALEALQAEVDALEASLATMQSELDTAEASLATAESDLESAETNIANLADVYFIEVAADGTKEDGSFGTSATKTGTGVYEVEFPVDDTADCTWSATIAQKQSLFGDPSDTDEGEISVETDFDFVVAAFLRDIDSIRVETHDSSGTGADRPFHLQITCGLPTGFFVPEIPPIIIDLGS